jgi:hypothetical protein
MDERCPNCEADLQGLLECVRCGMSRTTPGTGPLATADEDDAPLQLDAYGESDEIGRQSETESQLGDNAEDYEAQDKGASSVEGLHGVGDVKRGRRASDERTADPAREQETGESRDGIEEEPSPAHERASQNSTIKDSLVGQVLSVQGEGGIQKVFQNVFNLLQPTQPKSATERSSFDPERSKLDDEKSLLEFTTTLPPRNARLPQFSSTESQEYLAKLLEERLLLISCADEDFAISAAYSLIEQLNIPGDEQKRMLDFERIVGDTSPPNIYFLRRKTEAQNKTVILVDALNERARPFLNTIIHASPVSLESLLDDFKRNDIYLVCLVDANFIEDNLHEGGNGLRRAKELKFTHWQIPFLNRLLKLHFPQDFAELEAKIIEQRKRGWWSLNESEFCQELKSHIRKSELPEVLKAREASPEPVSVKALFKGSGALTDTVLYAATFFPNLTPSEFNQLVFFLLERRAKRFADNQSASQNAKGEETAPMEKAPADIWHEHPDSILRQCGLVAMPVKDSIKNIRFSNHQLKEKLREYLNSDYSIFLENQFESIYQLGLLFSSSSRVAESVMQITVEMNTSSPDNYGGEWLPGMLAETNRLLSSNSPAQTPRALQQLKAADPFRVRRQVYQRISELLHRMLEEPQGKETVDSFLQRLVLSKFYGAVLEFIKRLRTAPHFDEYKWLKQLIDNGDPEIRLQVYDYLYRHLKRMGTRVYQVLQKLEAWLPAEERPLQFYSVSARYALQLLMAYCTDTASKLDGRYLGAWPSHYSLFAFKDAATASDNLRLLTKWLFHPGMKSVFREHRVDDNPDSFLSILITQWMFILVGRGAESTAPLRSEGALEISSQAGSTCGPREVRNILLTQIIAVTDQSRQRIIQDYWELIVRGMLGLISQKPFGDPVREELIWRRNLITELMDDFKQLQAESQNAQ